MRILTVNTGSSSVKLALFTGPGGESDRLDTISEGRLSGDERELPADLLRRFLAAQVPENRVDVIAHRIVHGADRLVVPCLIDTEVEAQIAELGELAPLHNPLALRWVDACRELLGAAVPQVACFDTAYYAHLPDEAASYGLPAELCQRLHLRRYGFHGLAHQALDQAWRAQTGSDKGRVISLQLGSGCSITAIRDGRAVDTSMGFSPLEGLMMATRAGDLDPGLLLHLLGKQGGFTPDSLGELLNHRSGLLGVSGKSSDMRELMASTDAGARRAVDLYCYRARKYVGAYLAVLGGADAVLFGGGVGENQPEIRRRILEPLAPFGILVDRDRNQAARGVAAQISAQGSTVAVWVLPVDEARLLAETARQLVSQRPAS